MRTLDTALEAAQKKASLKPACKITLTHGETSYTIEENRIKKLVHIEEPWRVNAKGVILDNSDGYFTDLALQGYQAVISWGLHTSEGAKYSDTSPMWVTWQQLNSSPGVLSCELNILGIPDLMDEDEASEAYTPDEDDTKTVKTLLTQIAGATLSCFSHCQAFDVIFDSEDDVIGSYKPKDSFAISIRGSRLAAFKRALDYCGCVARVESDGKWHIFLPTTTGDTFDSEYSLSSGHTFLSKAYRKSLVLPNYIVVQSREHDDPQYSGSAVDAESYALLPMRTHYQYALESDDAADDIAAAILGRAQLNAEQGSASIPINCGSELYDYVNITDARESDYRVGNIGYIKRTFQPEKKIWEMVFGFGDPPTVRNTKDLYKALQRESGGFYQKDAYIENLWIDQINAIWLDPDSNIDLSLIGDTLDSLPDGELYARIKSMHLDAGVLQLDENVFYKAGYDPSEKWTGSDLDDLPDGETYQRVLSAALSAGGLVLLDEVQVGTYGLVKSAYISAGRILLEEASGNLGDINGDLDDIANGSTYEKVKATDISAGHILLSETVGDLDDISNGSTYGKVRQTDISAGYIKLSTDQDLDAQGIEIVSSSSTTRIRINEYRIAGYNAGTLQFELRASDGRAYAGGGTVILDEDGVTIKGEFLLFESSTGANRGTLFGHSSGLTLQAAYGYIDISASGMLYLGAGTGIDMSAADYFDMPERSSAPTGSNGRRYHNTTDHKNYQYVEGSWDVDG